MDTTVADVRALMTRATGDVKHDGSSVSTVDALWVLYERILRIDPARPDADDRDRFILSKGHGPAAMYAVLAARGFFPVAWLDRFMAHGGRLGSHPDRLQVPGIEASTGSLGHGLPMAVGVALALRAKGADGPRVFVLCGDAELNEGSNWEAVMLAPHLGVTNLTLLVIDNHSSSVAMVPWSARMEGFGWRCHVVDGRDHAELEAALSTRNHAAPAVVVADIRGGA